MHCVRIASDDKLKQDSILQNVNRSNEGGKVTLRIDTSNVNDCRLGQVQTLSESIAIPHPEDPVVGRVRHDLYPGRARLATD